MKNELSFTYERMKLLGGFDGRECKICPQIIQTAHGIFITYSMLLLSGSDVVNDAFVTKSEDGGRHFGTPKKLRRIENRTEEARIIFSTFEDHYSRYHEKWFAFGGTHTYINEKAPVCVGGNAVCEPKYIFRDLQSGEFLGEPMPLPMPFPCTSVVAHGQVLEYENGDMLVTFYVVPEGKEKSVALSVVYRYEKGMLSIVRSGSLLSYPLAKRGVGEPSLARLHDSYYITLRTDEQGLLSVSKDGLHFSEPMPWKWDDGSVLENYNTMQRWIRHKDGLFLAYTRKGAHNDHVFRHRAPLFMARFDEERLCLVRASEVILVPELGARLGNFYVTEMGEDDIWLSTAEWMQTWGNKPGICEKYGSDNSIWIAKIHIG